jgi:hypothetical protein
VIQLHYSVILVATYALYALVESRDLPEWGSATLLKRRSMTGKVRRLQQLYPIFSILYYIPFPLYTCTYHQSSKHVTRLIEQ